jgi:hypothetical protein
MRYLKSCIAFVGWRIQLYSFQVIQGTHLLHIARLKFFGIRKLNYFCKFTWFVQYMYASIDQHVVDPKPSTSADLVRHVFSPPLNVG